MPNEIASDEATAIALLLTDVIMPGMNGADLARRIGVMRPHLATLFMTGYARERSITAGNV
jgi:FixJ family two-component response regulator